MEATVSYICAADESPHVCTGRPPADDVNSGEEDEEDEEWIDSNATPRLLPSIVWDPVTKSAIS